MNEKFQKWLDPLRRRIGSLRGWKILVVVMVLAIFSCMCLTTIGIMAQIASPEPNLAPTLTPTIETVEKNEPEPTATTEPTETPIPPTATAEPTDTPAPTNTPRPTRTPRPTATEDPGDTYVDEVLDISGRYIIITQAMSILFEAAGNDPLLIFDDNWNTDVLAQLSSSLSVVDDIRALTPPDILEPTHAELLLFADDQESFVQIMNRFLQTHDVNDVYEAIDYMDRATQHIANATALIPGE